MAFEHEPFRVCEVSRLAEDLLRNRQLPEVVKRPGEARQLDLFRVQTEPQRDSRGQLRDALRVAAGVRVTRVDRLCKRSGRAEARGAVRAGCEPLQLSELDNFGTVEAHAVLAVLLRPVEGAVGESDQLVASVSLNGEGGEARAGGDAADVVEVECPDSFDDRVRGHQGRFLVVIDEQERKLVAAEPEGLAALPQLPRYLREDAIAGRMSKPVVDLLEVVDVHEAERQRRRVLLRRLQLALEPLVEVTVIAEPRERIRQRETHRP